MAATGYAAFNPDTPGISPDQTGASRGSIPNTAFAGLFENLGNVATAGVKAVDAGIQSNIREDVYKAYDTANDQFGVPAAVNQAQDAMDPKQTVAPQDLQDSLGHLNLLQRAFKNGDLKSYSYWGRLENEVKSLRTKYPGYREQIDNIVSDITGGTPANALRNGLIEEMAHNASEGNTRENSKFNFIQSNAEYLSPGTAASWQQDPEGQYARAFSEIQANKNQEQTVKANVSSLTLKKSLGEDVSNDAVAEGTRQMDQLSNSMFHDVGTALGKDYTDFSKAFDTVFQDGKIDPNELQNILPIANQLRTHYAQAVNDTWTRVDESGESLNSLSSQQAGARSEAIKQSMDSFNYIIDQALNGNAGILKMNQAKVDAMGQSDTLGILSSSVDARRLQALRAIGGDQWVGFLAMQPSGSGSGTMLSSIVDAVTGMSMNDILGSTPDEQKALGEYVQNIQNVVPTGEQGVATRKLIDNSLQTITSPDAPTDLSKKAASVLFSPKNNSFLTMFTPGSNNENWIRLYSELASPNITKRMVELGKESPELFQNYKSWVYDKWPALFAPAATDLNYAQDVSKGGIQYVYNPEENQFNLLTDPDKFPSTLSFPQEVESAQLRLSSINGALKTLSPIMEADGSDKEKVVHTLMDSLGIKNILYPSTGVKEPRTKDDQQQSKADTALQQSQDVALINAIGTAEGADYDTFSGGSNQGLTGKTVAEVRALQANFSSVPNAVSSAAGKPQIIQKTMDYLVENGILSDSELFDKEAQDRATVALMNRRGYQRYKAGKLPAKDFLDNLSAEWASIPNSSGVSSYLGVGNNDVTVGGEAIASLINGQ